MGRFVKRDVEIMAPNADASGSDVPRVTNAPEPLQEVPAPAKYGEPEEEHEQGAAGTDPLS